MSGELPANAGNIRLERAGDPVGLHIRIGKEKMKTEADDRDDREGQRRGAEREFKRIFQPS